MIFFLLLLLINKANALLIPCDISQDSDLFAGTFNITILQQQNANCKYGREVDLNDTANNAWFIRGRPFNATSKNFGGINVCDAVNSDGDDDPFDNAYGSRVDGFFWNDGRVARANRTQRRVVVGPVTLAGNGVQGVVEFSVLPQYAALRVLFSFFNPTNNDATIKFELISDLGSDTRTVVASNSKNDTKLSNDVRWAITNDQADLENDPVLTHAFFGPGNVTKPTTNTIISTDMQYGFDTIVATFNNFEIPAGERRTLMFFGELHSSVKKKGIAEAQAAASIYDSPEISSKFLQNIPKGVLPTIVNWNACAKKNLFADCLSLVECTSGFCVKGFCCPSNADCSTTILTSPSSSLSSSATTTMTTTKRTTTTAISATQSKLTTTMKKPTTTKMVKSNSTLTPTLQSQSILTSSSSSSAAASSSSSLTSDVDKNQTTILSISGTDNQNVLIYGIVGGVVALILLALILIFVLRRNTTKKQQQQQQNNDNNNNNEHQLQPSSTSGIVVDNGAQVQLPANYAAIPRPPQDHGEYNTIVGVGNRGGAEQQPQQQTHYVSLASDQSSGETDYQVLPTHHYISLPS